MCTNRTTNKTTPTATPNLPTLNETQLLKLRQLSLLTLASPFAPSTTPTPTSSSESSLSYSSLLTALSLPSTSALESLVTQTIYAGLITARLSPTSTPPTVHITSIAPLRDLRPQTLPALLQILQTWESRCTGMVTSLESQITAIKSTASQRSAVEHRRQELVDAAVLSEKPLFTNTTNTTTTNPLATGTGDVSSGTRSGRNGGGSGAAAAGQRLSSKRDLDEDEEDEYSEEDWRMDVDEGVGDVGMGAGGSSSGSRGAKRNRGRGSK
jgi:COP9 signalosome complex subunit 7